MYFYKIEDRWLREKNDIYTMVTVSKKFQEQTYPLCCCLKGHSKVTDISRNEGKRVKGVGRKITVELIGEFTNEAFHSVGSGFQGTCSM